MTYGDAIREALCGPDRCGEDVTRDGVQQPCGRSPAGLRMIWASATPYPVCALHAREDMVPLRHVVAAARHSLGRIA